MKKISSIIYVLLTFTSITFSQEEEMPRECDTLAFYANRSYGCGMPIWEKSLRLKAAADCYKENGEINKAIHFVESKIGDVNEGRIGSEGLIEKLIEYQRIKYGDKHVKNYIETARVKVEIFLDEFSLLYTDTAASTSIGASIELFGKEYSIYSNIESYNQIRNDFILKKVGEKELNEYFEKRWQESVMYSEIEKIK